MSRVTVSRPDAADIRLVLVDGRKVGKIAPDMSGCVTSRGRRPWFVTGEKKDAYGANVIGRAVRLQDAISWAREYPWPAARWVAMSGSHGCLPDYWSCCASRETALEALRELFGFGGRISRVLARDGYTALGRGAGAEYCEVVECECDNCRECTTEDADDWDCEDCTNV